MNKRKIAALCLIAALCFTMWPRAAFAGEDEYDAASFDAESSEVETSNAESSEPAEQPTEESASESSEVAEEPAEINESSSSESSARESSESESSASETEESSEDESAVSEDPTDSALEDTEETPDDSGEEEHPDPISSGNPSDFGDLEIPEIISVKWFDPNTDTTTEGILTTSLYQDKVYVSLPHVAGQHVDTIALYDKDDKKIDAQIQYTDTKAVFDKSIEFSEGYLRIQLAGEWTVAGAIPVSITLDTEAQYQTDFPVYQNEEKDGIIDLSPIWKNGLATEPKAEIMLEGLKEKEYSFDAETHRIVIDAKALQKVEQIQVHAEASEDPEVYIQVQGEKSRNLMLLDQTLIAHPDDILSVKIAQRGQKDAYATKDFVVTADGLELNKSDYSYDQKTGILHIYRQAATTFRLEIYLADTYAEPRIKSKILDLVEEVTEPAKFQLLDSALSKAYLLLGNDSSMEEIRREIVAVYATEKQSADRTKPANFRKTDEDLLQAAIGQVIRIVSQDGKTKLKVNTTTEVGESLLWDAKQLDTALQMMDEPDLAQENLAEFTETLIEEIPLWPIEGHHTLTTLYREPDAIYGLEHRGIDIDAPEGAPIQAVLSGIVVKAGWNASYGYFVKIDHGNGKSTLYAHMSELNASECDKVTQGDVIGYVGSTGDSIRPHLHLEWVEDDKLVDPLFCMK